MESLPDKLAVWDRMLDGFHASIAAVIDAGTAVAVDHVLQEKRWLPMLAKTLASRNVYFIGVVCPPDIALNRMIARGRAQPDPDFLGFQLERIHKHQMYDLEVDSNLEPADRLAERLLGLPASAQPKAFAELNAQFAQDAVREGFQAG